jgi:hypothetical protein
MIRAVDGRAGKTYSGGVFGARGPAGRTGGYAAPEAGAGAPAGERENTDGYDLTIAQDLVKDGQGYLPNGTDVKYVNGGNSGKPPFRDHLDYLDKQITLLGTGGLLTMLTESGSGTLAGSAHQEAFNQVAKADSVMVAEASQRDFDKPMLEKEFPGWPVEAGLELTTDSVNPTADLAG